jgi:hypothetical protein
MALSSNGFIIEWLYHRMALSSNGFIIQWLYHRMALSSNGFIIEWLYHQMALSSNGFIIKWLYHRMALSSNGFIIECINSSHFQNCRQNFFRPSRSKVINDQLRVSRNGMAKILVLVREGGSHLAGGF